MRLPREAAHRHLASPSGCQNKLLIERELLCSPAVAQYGDETCDACPGPGGNWRISGIAYKSRGKASVANAEYEAKHAGNNVDNLISSR